MRPLVSICSPQTVSSSISIFLLLLVTSLSFSVSCKNVEKQKCQTEECLSAAKIFKESMNFEVNPCDDFYKYACGNWIRNSEEAQRSSMLSRRAENYLEILAFLKQNNSNDEPKAVHKARKLFSLCQNEEAYKNDLEQIETTLEKIGIQVNNLLNFSGTVDYDYTTAFAKATKLAKIKLYFHVELLPNSHNQTTNTISLTVQKSNSPNSTTEEQEQYDKTKTMCGNKPSVSCERLLLLLSFCKNLTTEETVKQKSEILEVDTESNSMLDPCLPAVHYTLKQLQNLTDDIAMEINATIPTFNWTRYIEELFTDSNNVTTLHLSDPSKLQITIGDLNSVKEMLQYIHKKQSTKIIAYELSRKVIYTLQPYVDSSSKTELSCAEMIADSFNWSVSYMYATKEKYIKAKTEGRKMFENLRDVFHQLINQTTWMDEETKRRALNKLHSTRINIAYPSDLTNSSSLDDFYKDVQITDNFYDSKMSLEKHRYITKQKIDYRDDDWSQAPTIVNAVNRQGENSIYIFAAILGFSFYNGLDALYYGAIGALMGHEIAHGFDNIGRYLNETGDFENWWPNRTAHLYKEKTRCFALAKLNYGAPLNRSTCENVVDLGIDTEVSMDPDEWPGINAEKLGEDLSDNVGFKQSLLAYRKRVSVSGEEPSLPHFENFTHEQLFTLAYANRYCENPSRSLYRKILRDALKDVHSAADFRVNGVLQNSKEFPEIWQCPKGSRMNPDIKCELW